MVQDMRLKVKELLKVKAEKTGARSGILLIAEKKRTRGRIWLPSVVGKGS